jgi:hypothetical protein
MVAPLPQTVSASWKLDCDFLWKNESGDEIVVDHPGALTPVTSVLMRDTEERQVEKREVENGVMQPQAATSWRMSGMILA